MPCARDVGEPETGRGLGRLGDRQQPVDVVRHGVEAAAGDVQHELRRRARCRRPASQSTAVSASERLDAVLTA